MRWDGASLWPYSTGHTGLKWERGCKIIISHWITDVDFPNLMGGCNLVWEFEVWDILRVLFKSRASFCICFCNDKRGGLWMVRYSLYQGGRRLIFLLDKFCVRGQKCMPYCFTDMIYQVCIYGGSRGQRETFVRVTSRSMAYYLSQLVFALKARLLQSLVGISIVVSGSMEEVFAHGDEFPLAIFCCFRWWNWVKCWFVTVLWRIRESVDLGFPVWQWRISFVPVRASGLLLGT